MSVTELYYILFTNTGSGLDSAHGLQFAGPVLDI